MSGRVLLYGATGFTGRLIAERLVEMGIEPVLAGRDATRVRAVAEPLGLASRVFGLGDAKALAAGLRGIDVVLHAAGPFTETAEPMMAACLATGTHYLDLGGEWPVFQRAVELGEAAVAAGIMLMPGVGLTIVATDCLMALAVERQPDAVKLRLGVSWPEVISRGTVASAANLFGPGVLIRRGGELATVPAGTLTHAFDFGDGLCEATAFSWADVVTAPYTTGVGDIEIYSQTGWPQRVSYRASGMAMTFTGAALWRKAVTALATVWPEGPSDDDRHRAGFIMVVEALDPWRRVTRLRMHTIDGYTASVVTAAAAVEQVLGGNWTPGFQTPARQFGADFVLATGCAVLDEPAARMAGDAA